MRKLVFFIICLSIQHTTFTGCICQLDPPPYAYSVAINLLDNNTGRTLIALKDSNYYADSIILETVNPLRTYRMVVGKRDTILRSEFVFPGALGIDTLYFRYRTTKTDTVIVFFHDETRKACGERFVVIEIDKATVNEIVACTLCNDYAVPLQIRK